MSHAPQLITKPQLKSWSACRGGYEWFLRRFPAGEAEYTEVYPALLADKRKADAEWLFERCFSADASVDQTLAAVVRFVTPASQHHELLIGSNRGRELELVRSRLAMDWLIRTHLPAWLEMSPTLAEHAAKLRALAPVTDEQSLAAAMSALDQARRAADAARVAAWDAAWVAAQKAEGGYEEKYTAARAVADALLQPTKAALAESSGGLLLAMVNAELREVK